MKGVREAAVSHGISFSCAADKCRIFAPKLPDEGEICATSTQKVSSACESQSNGKESEMSTDDTPYSSPSELISRYSLTEYPPIIHSWCHPVLGIRDSTLSCLFYSSEAGFTPVRQHPGTKHITREVLHSQERSKHTHTLYSSCIALPSHSYERNRSHCGASFFGES